MACVTPVVTPAARAVPGGAGGLAWNSPAFAPVARRPQCLPSARPRANLTPTMTRHRLLGDSRWVPLLPQPRLPRADLVGRLLGIPSGGVAVIVSPVGYGATSLLALAAEASQAPVVWLSGRGQAGTGGVHVAPADRGAGFRRCRGARRARERRSRLGTVSCVRVAELMSAASDVPEFLLVLDDMPRDEVVEAMVQQVLDELPASMRVMISSAAVPRLDLSRHAGAGQLVLLERADLVLRREEAEDVPRTGCARPACEAARLPGGAGRWVDRSAAREHERVTVRSER